MAGKRSANSDGGDASSGHLNSSPRLRAADEAVVVPSGPTFRRFHPLAHLLLLLLTMICLAALYYRVFVEFPSNSDVAGGYLAAEDMAAGNWQLKGWSWGSDTFWTLDLALEALLIKLLGHHPTIVVLTAAIEWAGMVLLSVAVCRAGGPRGLSALLPIAVITAVPILRDNGPMPLIAAAPMHIGSVLSILTMFLLVPIASSVRVLSAYALVAFDVVTVLGVVGDPLVLVLGVGSVVLVTGLGALVHGDRRQVVVLANAVGAALLGEGIVALNQAMGGIHTPGDYVATFVAFEQLGRNISLTLHSLLILTGSDFFGRPLGAAALYLIRFPVLVSMVWALIVVGRRFIGSVLGSDQGGKLDLIDKLLLVAVTINVLAGVMSGLLYNITAARYFIPAVVFLAILAGRTLPAVRPITIYGCFALVASVWLVGASYARTPPQFALIPPADQQLGDFLVQHQLTHGYAPYWSASIVTIATRGAVRVAPIDPDGAGKVRPVHWVSKGDWYGGFGGRDRSFFVVIDKHSDWPRGSRFVIQEQPVIATFGEPTRQYDMPAHSIMVFDPSGTGR